MNQAGLTTEAQRTQRIQFFWVRVAPLREESVLEKAKFLHRKDRKGRKEFQIFVSEILNDKTVRYPGDAPKISRATASHFGL